MARCLLIGLNAAVCLFFWANQIFAQQQDIDTMLGVHGWCDEFVLSDRKENCGSDGILYTHLRNGRVLIIVGMADGRAVEFVGEKDSQPRLEEYWLYLSRIRIGSRGSQHVLNVAGQCVIQMSKDGTVWSRVNCDATDENSARYRLLFRGDGHPVDVRIGRHHQ
jgi:hypothetical protein